MVTVMPESSVTDNRFAFGANWRNFLSTLDDECIRQAEESLKSMLRLDTFHGLRFLDIGCGSGLFSLAARNLGATVLSFDFDPESVACAEELKRRYRTNDEHWTIMRQSVLDVEFMSSLGKWDVVYSWGVLHHTGDLWRTLDLAASAVAANGRLFIAIYNDQGGASRRWSRVKRLYNSLPGILRPALVVAVAGVFETRYAAARLVRLQNPLPFSDWRQKKQDRGMSAWHDWVDWIGGWPFEVAKPEQVIVPLRERGFVLDNLVTCGGGHGCNQYVFRNSRS